MGRIFEKRKDRMFARWSKTAKAFTKVGKEIAIAVKLGGPHPEGNPRLRMGIQTARSLNMPKDRIEAAIKRASGKEQADLQEITYAGYAPHGVALLIAAATDNPTRTAANIRAYFSHNGGSLAAAGSLDFMFKRRASFRIKVAPEKMDELELSLIDHGLEEAERDQGEMLLDAAFESFGQLQKALEERGIEVLSAGSPWVPSSNTELTEAQEKEVRELIELIEEDDDVQHVFDAIA
jgi:YebC/PmpR family DNA-binding regulatory protein